ncbi:ABC transporter substrate-binding protein [Chloroflexota bacterium]
MKKRIVWLVVSCLLVASLVLTSCAPAVTEEEEVVKKEEVKKEEVKKEEVVKEEKVALGPEVPKYGGTFIGIMEEPTVGFDDGYSPAYQCLTSQLTQEEILGGDWSKGPAGTDETEFWFTGFYSFRERPLLAESWEMPDPDTIIFHIRKGVHWHNKPPVNGRELTAEDVAFSIDRIYRGQQVGRPTSKQYPGWFESATATDKWTVMVKCHDSEKYRTPYIVELMADTMEIVAPEVIEKYGSQRDWRNVVGTGPFMLVDHVPGSTMTLERHPNYWGKDPLHPENQLPYLDSMTWLVILDPSTRIAALRTGKADWFWNVGRDDAASLKKSTPELQWKRRVLHKSGVLFMRVDKPELPYGDIRVRRALHMAIDFEAIKDDYYGGEAEVLFFPIAPVFKKAYTPLDQLPESTRELFEYQPDKAKQLLAEAGYPDGFKATVLTEPHTEHIDLLSIVQKYFADIGVELELDVRDYSVYKSIQVNRTHDEMIFYRKSLSYPMTMYEALPLSSYNLSMISDPVCDEIFAKVWAFETYGDQAVQDKLLNSHQLQYLSQAYVIQVPVPLVYTMWWPWVQNYHGEYSVGRSNHYNFPIWIWVDQDMKKAMMGK